MCDRAPDHPAAGLGKPMHDPRDRLARALDALEGVEELVLLGHRVGLHDVTANGLASLLRLILDEARAAECALERERG